MESAQESDLEPHGERARLDKWLWAARFYKTRSLAAQAVSAGKVRLNAERTKPAKELKLGDELRLHIGQFEWIVLVRATSGQRRGAPEAQRLYEETPESKSRRMQAIENRKAHLDPLREERGRPTKRDRRSIVRFTRGE